jgi:hypothetical protein
VLFSGSDDEEVSFFELHDDEATAFMDLFRVLDRFTERGDDVEEY